MVRRHPRLGRDVRKQPTLIHKCAPHASPRRFVIEKLNHDTLAMARVFQQTVSLTESESRGPSPIRISYRARFRHRQRGLIWISERQRAVNRDLRHMSRNLWV